MKDSLSDVYKANYAHQGDLDRLSEAITNLSLIVKEYSTKQDLFISELRNNGLKLENQLNKIELRLVILEDDKKGRDTRINLFYRLFKIAPSFFLAIIFIIFIGGITIFDYVRKDANYFIRKVIHSQEQGIANGVVSTSN